MFFTVKLSLGIVLAISSVHVYTLLETRHRATPSGLAEATLTASPSGIYAIHICIVGIAGHFIVKLGRNTEHLTPQAPICQQQGN